MSDWHEEEAKAECLDLRTKVAELEAQLQTLREAAPDHKRVKATLRLVEAEYVGQPFGRLWQWAWEQALDNGEVKKE